MKLTKILAVIMMALMFFIVSCGEDEEKTEDKNHITVSDNLKEDEHGMVILSFAN